jgi:diguanylate cyclase (GGDEF)-like protein/PAS domain S-box-containing protein
MPTILILDDRATNRNIYARMAASLGEDVTVAKFGDPEEALVWLGANAADLIITDYKMPKLDGAEFTRRVREHPTRADTPVIVITIYEERELRMRALEAGATDFLHSPVEHREFLTRARNLLALSRYQRSLKHRASMLEQKLQDSERSRQELLRESRERLAQVIDTIPAMISATDESGRCIFFNAYHAGVIGADPTDAPIAAADSPGRERSSALDRIVFEAGEALPSFEEEVTDGSGKVRVFLTTKSPLRDYTGRVASVLTTSLDITARKHAERQLRRLAHYDPLTNLPNRLLLRNRLRRELARGRRGDRAVALHLLDLDRFKGVNDILGHHLGDRVLQAVARRLADTVRESNMVARLGGDEFAILQTDIGCPEDAAALARCIVESFVEPFHCEGREFALTASIGITLAPADGTGVDELLRNADLAMYRAKSEGNAFRFYIADLKAGAQRAAALEMGLRDGLAGREFVVFYQPQIELQSGRIVGAEALLRWERPGVGMVWPGEFLPQAEANGLIVPINTWVLREVCRWAAQWQRRGLPPLRWAVNLSPVQFRKQNVLRLVLDASQETGLDPAALDLELTEGILVDNAEAAATVMRELRSIGVGISIDDFGTGYSSLSYVKNFPVDRIKIDQSFVRSLQGDPTDTAIVRAIINLGHSINLGVVAEGVETIEQLTQLAAEGCDEVQGYLLSPPLRGEDFEQMIRSDGLRGTAKPSFARGSNKSDKTG